MQLTRTHTHTHTCHLSVECVILYFRCSKFRTTTPRFFLFFPPIFFIFFFFTRVAQLPLLLVSQRTSLLHLLRPVSFYFCCFSCKSATRRSRSSRWFFPIWPFNFCIFSFSNVVNNIQFLQLFLYRKLPAHTRYTHTRSLPLFKIPTPTPCLLSCIRIYLYSNMYFVVIWLHIIWFICFQYNFQLVCPSAILFPFFIENFKFVFLVFFFRY